MRLGWLERSSTRTTIAIHRPPATEPHRRVARVIARRIRRANVAANSFEWTIVRPLTDHHRTICIGDHRRSEMSVGEIVDFAALDANIQELIRESVAVRENSYSPYSKFKVGAAIRCADGSISRGCNVENVSFPAGVCAEMSAITRAVSDGRKKFTTLAVAADNDSTVFTTPCGVCRQVIAEFGDIPIYLTRTDMKQVLRIRTIYDLFPLAFNGNNLNAL